MLKSSGKIKVLHVTIGLDLGGVEVFLSHLLPGFDREKYDVTVCSLKKEKIIGERLRSSGISVVSLEGNNKNDINILIKLFRLIRTGEYDIVQSHLFLANLASAFAVFLEKISFSRKVPFFVASHHELGLWQNRGHQLLERFISSVSQRIVFCSEAVKKEWSSRCIGKVNPEKCLVIYNGIRLEDLEKDLKAYKGMGRKPHEHEAMESWFREGEFIIGSIGRLDEKVKGFEYLIRAVHRMKERVNCKLLIIGNGQDKEFLMRTVEELQLTSHVKIIQQDHPGHVFKYFDLFVLPSLSEGFGLVLLEAMTAKIPVVATRIGGIPEVVVEGETGLLVPARDPKALADAIFYMKTHPVEAQEMGKKGRKRVEEYFSIDNAVAEYEKLYDNIIAYPAN